MITVKRIGNLEHRQTHRERALMTEAEVRLMYLQVKIYQLIVSARS